jgi:hypothetical protein
MSCSLQEAHSPRDLALSAGSTARQASARHRTSFCCILLGVGVGQTEKDYATVRIEQ